MLHAGDDEIGGEVAAFVELGCTGEALHPICAGRNFRAVGPRCELGHEALAVGIDALDGNVQVSGWTEDSHIRAIGLARKLQYLGARLVIYTDISRDGVLEGPNVDAVKEMLESTDLSVIASGGVSSIADVRHLAELDHWRLDGVIIGKALYEGRIEMEEALANAR